MAIRFTLECGHTSMLRMRTTPEGYTHDWEVFVRGVDNTDIHHYIEKVVFNLHDTFRNPKRVLKEPPFVVKESGYAGFIMLIEVYLKNKDEPKKVLIHYDLNLQPSGPPINQAMRHSELISNPSDEFKKKLLKGGAIMVSNRDNSLEKSDIKIPTMIGKPKLNGSESKKHRITESKTSNSFQELFGPPIKTTPIKISPDSKKTNQSDKNSVPKSLTIIEKSDKLDKIIKTKESPHKDKKDKIDEKKEKIRNSSKDRLKNKEKSKRSLSPGNKSHLIPVNKKSTSPVVTKKPLSPLPSSTKRSLSPKLKEKEVKKILLEKDKEKDKAKNNSRSNIDSFKSEKKKDKKKHKDDKDKEKKDKYKEEKVKDVMKMTEKKPEKPGKAEKSDKEKSQEFKLLRDKKSPKSTKENDRVRDDKVIKEKSEKNEKFEKIRDDKSDKDRQKHKHKKRDKKDKKDSKDQEKKEKRERSKDGSEKQNNMSSASIGNSLSLLTEIPERDSSDSARSVDDDSLLESKSMLSVKDPIISMLAETIKSLSPSISVDIKKEKNDHSRKDKSKGSRGEEKEDRKRKRSKENHEISIKHEKGRGHSTSPPLEPVSSSQSPVAMDVDSVHHSEKESKKDFRKEKDDCVINSIDQVINNNNNDDMEIDAERVAPDSTNSTDAEISEPRVFSEDYVSQLKALQQKIMTLQDNEGLQRVVQVIAETGQYEITKKTFDFDLCALNRRTVQRLQEFFSAS